MLERQTYIVRITAASLGAAPAASLYIGALMQANDTGLHYVARVVDGTPTWLATSDPLAFGTIGES